MSKWIVDIHGDIEGDYEIIGEYVEPKTGHWIKAYWTTRLICSRCNKLNHSKWKPYCYECGSKNAEIVKIQKYGAESEE